MALIDPRASARLAGLRYTSDEEPGIERRPWGRGFTYLDADGKRITEPEIRARFEALAIPPAYERVWICSDPDGHIQATGYDERGRKQYLYHRKWRAVRDRLKFDHLLDFGEALPALRRRVKRDMHREGLPRERVLATAVHLLDTTLIRIGNRSYATENGSYGLTTLRRKHTEIDGDLVEFAFEGKSGRPWHIEVEDPLVAEVVRRCDEIPGYQLFNYLNEEGERVLLDAADVNGYLQEISGADVTAKDFRTWAGTVLTGDTLFDIDIDSDSDGEAERRSALLRAIEATAERLGNTPAVARASYIHPLLIERFEAGELTRPARAERSRAPRGLRAAEKDVWLVLG